MRTRMLARAVVLAVAGFAITEGGLCTAQAADGIIELKGIHIGMTKEEYDAIVPDMPPGYGARFTLAGVHGKQAKPKATFKDDRLVSWSFFFNSASFDEMRATIGKKYPKAICRLETLENAFAATFEQWECVYGIGDVRLRLKRFVNDIRTSSVNLASMAWLDEWAEERETSADGDL